MNRRSMMLTALALAGCAATPRLVSSPDTVLPELEPLYGAEAARDGLTISVASSGCTAKADFAFYAERRGSTLALAFARRRLDPCKSFAMGRTALTFSWAELGVSGRRPVAILNRLEAWPGP